MLPGYGNQYVLFTSKYLTPDENICSAAPFAIFMMKRTIAEAFSLRDEISFAVVVSIVKIFFEDSRTPSIPRKVHLLMWSCVPNVNYWVKAWQFLCFAGDRQTRIIHLTRKTENSSKD